MSYRQDRQSVLQALLMALWQRKARTKAIFHSHPDCKFTGDAYQRLFEGA